MNMAASAGKTKRVEPGIERLIAAKLDKTLMNTG